mmetsp:Transcript_34600/g.51370  ORF Transcript_34600/g.51370 Transcript_34600/m.51370 type:complete len:278 (-) Transcript_34600:294-1127(-)
MERFVFNAIRQKIARSHASCRKRAHQQGHDSHRGNHDILILGGRVLNKIRIGWDGHLRGRWFQINLSRIRLEGGEKEWISIGIKDSIGNTSLVRGGGIVVVHLGRHGWFLLLHRRFWWFRKNGEFFCCCRGCIGGSRRERLRVSRRNGHHGGCHGRCTRLCRHHGRGFQGRWFRSRFHHVVARHSSHQHGAIFLWNHVDWTLIQTIRLWQIRLTKRNKDGNSFRFQRHPWMRPWSDRDMARRSSTSSSKLCGILVRSNRYSNSLFRSNWNSNGLLLL